MAINGAYLVQTPIAGGVNHMALMNPPNLELIRNSMYIGAAGGCIIGAVSAGPVGALVGIGAGAGVGVVVGIAIQSVRESIRQNHCVIL